MFIDGGAFANDPELAALATIRIQWKKPVNYHLLSIGTECYNAEVSTTHRDGYLDWLFRNKGLLINMFLDSTRSFTDTVANNLAKFDNIGRMKFNYKLIESMDLDDSNFVSIFKKEWETLKNEENYKALLHFYNKYIRRKSLLGE